MRYVNSSGRRFRPAARDILAVACRIRQWRIAGTRIAQADDLLAELDQLAARYPIHVRRLECLRAALVESVMSSIISIPNA